ncbi:MAG: hypothetical protein CSB24_05840 [Deltaproteobacteria bacterium]|nr:MAG: hypothetical protein CSB24_05840 [Deltaproteobacteria bacterium]
MNKTKINRIIIAVILILSGLAAGYYQKDPLPKVSTGKQLEQAGNNLAILQAFEQHQSGVMLSGSGEIIKVLPDDNSGIRHQKFIVRTGGRQTVLIAHNIDLAPRVKIKIGDEISFRGEYEWNARGGLVHWTHHDPQGRHPEGWLKVKGEYYK